MSLKNSDFWKQNVVRKVLSVTCYSNSRKGENLSNEKMFEPFVAYSNRKWGLQRDLEKEIKMVFGRKLKTFF